MDFSFKQYAFGRQEKISHTKLNSLLNVHEMNRTLFGPHSFEIYGTPTASGFNIKFTDDPDVVGGQYETGGDYFLYRDFQASMVVADSGYSIELRFDKLAFQWDDTAGGYLALVTGVNLVSPRNRYLGLVADGNINVSTASTSNVKLFSTDYKNEFLWGDHGRGLELVSSGGITHYFFVTEAGVLRTHTSKPASDSDGSAV